MWVYWLLQALQLNGCNLQYLIAHEGLSSSQYLTTLQAGTEATSGSATLTTFVPFLCMLKKDTNVLIFPYLGLVTLLSSPMRIVLSICDINYLYKSLTIFHSGNGVKGIVRQLNHGMSRYLCLCQMAVFMMHWGIVIKLKDNDFPLRGAHAFELKRSLSLA